MKPTDHFKKVIETRLQEMAIADPLFAVSLVKEKKNIDDCITYILNSVQKSKCNGFTDDEIFSLAAHYYDEDNINVGNPIDCQVVINQVIELTDEEKEKARKEAYDHVIAQERERLLKKVAPKPATMTQTEQPTLF